MGWVSLFDVEAVQRLLHMPADARPVAILCIGHVDHFYDEPMLQQEGWAKRMPVRACIAENGWPEIRESIVDAGITSMEIYRTGNRLFMIMETGEGFSFEEKQKKDANNPRLNAWEELMWKFQQPLPWAADGEKWILMKKIFSLAG